MTTKPSVFAALGKTLTLSVLSVALALPTYAQKTTETGKAGAKSPHVKTEWVVAPANISIEYGRPSLKGRDMEALMRENGPEWRTGADQPSIITTDKALKFGNVTLQPGSYTINTVPGDTEWQIAFGKLATPPQWGVPYRKDLEIARAPMKLGKTAAPVEMVTFLIEPGKSAGTLKIEWGTKSASIPFTVLP
ncbi:MAG: DUF2911 domain-containing protein [Phycisphaerae bacterium]|nr:DUF2911 domain-containing protein [Gemmatimonadaceae bacterium]